MKGQERIDRFYRQRLAAGELLYGRRASQRERFVNAIEHFNPYGKHVVEIGSGTGDFLKFLFESQRDCAIVFGIGYTRRHD